MSVHAFEKNHIFERRAALFKCSLLFLDICEQQQNEQISEPLVLVQISVNSYKVGIFQAVHLNSLIN